MTAVDASPQATLLDRLAAQQKADEPWALVVLAACDGPEALARYLDDGVEPKKPTRPKKAAKSAEPKETPRAYLEAIGVRGFRGIGPDATVNLQPGPGLTLVVGRNGSGKSSFAEAIEVLLTGDSVRWSAKGSRFWKEGWRNLHAGTEPRLRARLLTEGIGAVELTRVWAEGQEVEDGTTVVKREKSDADALSSLGWDVAVENYRPFMSHSELGSLLDEGPSKLYRALLKGLGLEAFDDIRDNLAKAQATRKKARTDTKGAAKELIDLCKRVQVATPDERLAKAIALLEAKDADHDALAALATGTGANESSLLSVLGFAAREKGPDAANIQQVVDALREAHHALVALATQEAGRASELATLLAGALAFTEKTGDATCPVCETPEVLTKAWRSKTTGEIKRLRESAKALKDVDTVMGELKRAAQAQCASVPPWLADLRLDADLAKPVREAWQRWSTGLRIDDVEKLIAHLEGQSAPLRDALAGLNAWAEHETAARQDVWQPIAGRLAEWVEGARAAIRGQQQVTSLKKAEDWLKEAIEELRQQRFQPIGASAMENWALMRLQSNVDLTAIVPEGVGKAQSVDLRVTVDGLPAGALGVMSQGELNSLALSLFLPRASLPESPFGFVIVDDPVQAMDPARVEGLARVLERTSKTRQVVVFTHDDRLPEAIRRLQIEANQLDVMRRANSVVEVRTGYEPVDAYLKDAQALMATARKGGIPDAVILRVVPGFCRAAIEASCVEVIRRRRLKKGERHADVEQLLEACKGLNTLMSLVLYDDPERGGDVSTTIKNKWKDETLEVYKACQSGSHGDFVGDLGRFVSRAGTLTGQIRKLP